MKKVVRWVDYLKPGMNLKHRGLLFEYTIFSGIVSFISIVLIVASVFYFLRPLIWRERPTTNIYETSTKETYNTTNYQTSTTTEVQNYTPEINFKEYQISRTKHNKAGSISEPNLASFEKIQTPIPTLQKKFNLKETKSILIPNVKIPHPQFAQKDEIIYSVVTPLKTNISNNVPGGMVAKVSVVKHFGTATYRPGADDNKKKLNT